MTLVGFQHDPVSLDVNKVCFEEEQDIPNTHEKSITSQSVTEWCRCGKWGVIRRWSFGILSVIRYEMRW